MESFYTVLFAIQVIIAVCLVGFILIQHGKGADAGAAFGSGASSTVFGSQGSSSFLTKVTTFLAIVFLGNSLFLAYLASKGVGEQATSIMDQAPVTVEAPITDEPAKEETASDSETASDPETVSEPETAPEPEPIPSDLPTLPE